MICDWCNHPIFEGESRITKSNCHFCSMSCCFNYTGKRRGITVFKSKEQKIIESMIKCYKCGALGNASNELIDVTSNGDNYIKVVCEKCAANERERRQWKQLDKFLTNTEYHN